MSRIAASRDQERWDEELWYGITGPWDGQVERVRTALENGADLANLSMHRESPLAVALQCCCSRPIVVKLLVDAGAKPANVDEEKRMFERYTRDADADMLHYLFSSRVFESLEIGDILYALHYFASSCKDNSLPIMRICIHRAISRYADLDQFITSIDYEGNTLLHSAVKGLGYDRRIPMVRMLIDYGADVLQTDRTGHTPEECARIRDSVYSTPGSKKLIAILEEARIFQEKLRLDKCVAFSMGHHDRLGSESMMTGLDPAILRQICESILLPDPIVKT